MMHRRARVMLCTIIACRERGQAAPSKKASSDQDSRAAGEVERRVGQAWRNRLTDDAQRFTNRFAGFDALKAVFRHRMKNSSRVGSDSEDLCDAGGLGMR